MNWLLLTSSNLNVARRAVQETVDKNGSFSEQGAALSEMQSEDIEGAGAGNVNFKRD